MRSKGSRSKKKSGQSRWLSILLTTIIPLLTNDAVDTSDMTWR